jgi:NOL1/NOP2/fmu family ribosome biogenesis protein
LNYLLFEVGKQKVRGFSGSMSKDEINELSRIANIEIIGLYLFSMRDKDIRINFDAVPILKSQISKSIITISKSDLDIWLHGKDLDIKKEPGVYILQYESDLVGCAKSNGEKLFNYIPKERQLKN